VADYWNAIFQDISVCLGIIENGNTILIKQTVIESKPSYQPGALNTHLRHRSELDVPDM